MFVFVSVQINSLSVMNDNPSYLHLERLDADNNWIESLLDLEGTEFIQNFHILYLRKNRLKSVCVNLLSLFDAAEKVVSIFFSFSIDSILFAVILIGSESRGKIATSRRQSFEL